MFNPEFVKLNATKGEQYFRKEDIKYFGFFDNTSTVSGDDYEVRIVYQSSQTTTVSTAFAVASLDEYNNFRDQMLEPNKASTNVDVPATDDASNPNSTRTLYMLEITAGIPELYNWLRGLGDKGPANWGFHEVPAKDNYRTIMCDHYKQSASLELRLYDDHPYGLVMSILSLAHRDLSDTEYNYVLDDFVEQVIMPYSENHNITAVYTQPTNNRQTISNQTK